MADNPESPGNDVHKFICTQGVINQDQNLISLMNVWSVFFVCKKVTSGLTDVHRYAYEYQSTTW